MDKCLGFGGLGDCFIVMLKLFEYKKPYIYTHIDKSRNRLNSSIELLDKFDIPHKCLVVHDIKCWWHANSPTYDKCFNVFAAGHINIPIRPYHWQPCVDEGYTNPFCYWLDTDKEDKVAVQVASGGDRNYKERPVVEYTTAHFEHENIIWIGTDKDFTSDVGTNMVGKLTLSETLDVISKCKYFVGFPSVLLYYALWCETECFLFTDHQGQDDLRIHDEWKKHITYDK